MHLNSKPPELAYIRADECIGCTKCIQACPFDAILGAPKHLHAVLREVCIGCGLCVAPCPVDCIEMQPIEALICQPEQAKERVKARKQRLRRLQAETEVKKLSTSSSFPSFSTASYVKEAIARARAKRTIKH